ncbi:MAG TPA: type II toxin-antitoxin system ParD family antitoxin [Tepidisphaeraceae bacterium]|jgi:antitoxin ParD1/3/4|nr:type II toxin-antitoxin system ParD family antitoxin [Tepidisphaeraceae bacterium]
MRLNLKPATEQLIRQKVSSGQYSTPSDVVEAALFTLEQQEKLELEPEEVRRLIAEGEASIKEHGTIDSRTALRRRRQRRAAARTSKK